MGPDGAGAEDDDHGISGPGFERPPWVGETLPADEKLLPQGADDQLGALLAALEPALRLQSTLLLQQAPAQPYEPRRGRQRDRQEEDQEAARGAQPRKPTHRPPSFSDKCSLAPRHCVCVLFV